MGDAWTALKRSITSGASTIPPGPVPQMSRVFSALGSVDISAIVRDTIGWLEQPDNNA